MSRDGLVITLILAVVLLLFPNARPAQPTMGGGGLFTESAVLDTSQVEAGYQPPVRTGRRGH